MHVGNLEMVNSLKCKYFHTNSYNSAMAAVAQDDHLTAGARAAYAWVRKVV